MRIPLVVSTFDQEEVNEVIDSLGSDKLMMGEKCLAFEQAFTEETSLRR